VADSLPDDWEDGADDWEEAPPSPAGPSEVDSFLRGGRQGAALGFADEDTALKATALGVGADALTAIREGRFSDLAGLPSKAVEGYRTLRDAERRMDTQAREANPKAFIGGEIVGGAPAVLLPGGTSRTAYLAATGAGALSGAGHSEEATPAGVVGDAALGGALGLGGKAVGDALGEGVTRASRALMGRAQEGKAYARELAGALAERDVGKIVQSLRGEAGGAASRAANVVSNIDDIRLPTDAPGRTVGELRDAISAQIRTLDNAMAEARARAIASGLDPDNLGVGRAGEFLAKGSKLDAAQKSAQKLASYAAAREALEQQLDDLAGVAGNAALPDDMGALRSAQAGLREDPRFLDLKQNVLRNSLEDFPDAAAEAVGRREAYRQALASRPEAVAKRSEQLLSGGAAVEQVKQRVQRYAAPLAGSLMGGGAGAAVGLAVGNDPTDALLYGLGGAGARPALAAVRRMAGHPAVLNAAWSSLEAVAKTAPETLGKYAGVVTSALARGPEALRAVEKVLNDTDPEWRTMRQKQASSTQ
jgi:hypothetical protein